MRARPQPQQCQLSSKSRSARGGGYPGALRRDPRGPGLSTHISGAEQGPLGLGGGSSLRSGFLLPATVLTRFLESPSDIYLTSWFSLPGAGRRDGGRAQGGGGWRRWGAKGETFSSLRQAAAASLLRGVPPQAPRPPGVSQLLGVKGKKESRWFTPTSTPIDLRPEEIWGGVTSLTAYTESEAVPGCQSLGSPIPCPSNERPRPGGARGAHRPLSSDQPPVWARHFTSARLHSPVCKRESLLLPRLP